jgi:protein SCO1/2
MTRKLNRGKGPLLFLVSIGVLLALLVAFVAPAQAQGPVGNIKQHVGIDQKVGSQLPLDLAFRDDRGETVKLGDYFGTHPVILTLNYFHCPNLCSFMLDQLGEDLAGVSFNLGEEYSVVTVSLDPRDTPPAAASSKWEAVRHYARPGLGSGWHFLTGEAASIQSLTRAVGFRYVYDPQTDEFAHPLGLVFLTPQGKITRHIYGDDFPSADLRLALVEAAQGRIGTPVDQLLLLCYHYDPSLGKYSALILNITRVAGGLTVVVFAAALSWLWYQDFKRDHPARPTV